MKKIKGHLFVSFLIYGIMLIMSCLTVQAASNPIKNGYYMIQSGNSSSRVLDINNFSLNNGGNLEIYNKNKTTNQVFYLQYRNNGYYSIRAVHSGKYLHKSGSGTNVHQWDGYNNANALWEIKSAGNGYYYLRNKNSGLYLDNSGGYTTLGNNVIVYKFNKSNAQKWKFISTGKPAFSATWVNMTFPSGTLNNPSKVRIKGEVRPSYPVKGMQVAIYNSSAKRVTSVEMAPSGLNYSFEYIVDLSSLKSGRYFFGIKLKNANNEELQSLQYWFNVQKSAAPTYCKPKNGTYYIASGLNNTYVVDVNRTSNKNGANIQLYTNKRVKNQRFIITHISNGWYKIIDSNSNKSLDVAGGIAKSGINVQLWAWANVDAQLWRFYSAGNGYYYIQNKLGYYLDVSGGVVKNGTNIQVYTKNNTNSQKWKLMTENDVTNYNKAEVNKVSVDYNTQNKKLFDQGTKMLNQVETAYNGAKKEAEKNMAYKIDVLLDPALPEAVKKVFEEKIITLMEDALYSDIKSLNNIKTSTQLVNWVINGCMGGRQSFYFTTKDGLLYHVSIVSQTEVISGAIVYFINISYMNRTYHGIATKTKKDVSEEIEILKKFAETKIDEAKKAVYSEIKGILLPDEFLSFLKTTAKSQAYSLMKNYSSSLASKISKAETMVKKFKDLKKAYEDVTKLDLGNADLETVGNKILNYNKKIEAWNKAVNAFVG